VRPILGAVWPGGISWASVKPVEDSGPTLLLVIKEPFGHQMGVNPGT